ncbi:hypothetical protein MRX96_032231 [Rhipicephalus microplus]
MGTSRLHGRPIQAPEFGRELAGTAFTVASRKCRMQGTLRPRVKRGIVSPPPRFFHSISRFSDGGSEMQGPMRKARRAHGGGHPSVGRRAKVKLARRAARHARATREGGAHADPRELPLPRERKQRHTCSWATHQSRRRPGQWPEFTRHASQTQRRRQGAPFAANSIYTDNVFLTRD